MNKRFLLIFGVLIAIFFALVLFGKDSNDTQTAAGELTNHTYGEGSSGVKVVEYGDFQCPACLSYFPIFAQLKEQYKDEVTFQFRHFPIVSAHRHAMAAHRAAEAASRQGKFWEMHDMLFSQQTSWEGSNNVAQIFEGYAQQLGLDMEQYKRDLADNSTAANIQADFKEGQQAGVQGTPAFFIDDKLIESPRSIEDFEKLIDEAIKEKSDN